MATEHNNLVLFIRTVDLTYHVIAGLSFGHDVATKIEFKLDRSPIREKARNAAEILVSHYNRRNDLCNVKGSIIERPHSSAVQLRFIYPNQHFVIEQKFIDLFVDLSRRQGSGPRCRWRPASRAARPPKA